MTKDIMNDKILLRTALVTALIGIAGLFVISEDRDLEAFSLSAITAEHIGQELEISGMITGISDREDVMMIELHDGSRSIKAVVFKDGKLDLKEGDEIRIKGEISEFDGSLEIIANEIQVTS